MKKHIAIFLMSCSFLFSEAQNKFFQRTLFYNDVLLKNGQTPGQFLSTNSAGKIISLPDSFTKPNIFNASDTIDSNRIVSIDTFFLMFGDYLSNNGIILGNLTSIGGDTNMLYSNFGTQSFRCKKLFVVHSYGDGFFIGANGVPDNPETVFVGVKQGTENIGAITVYDSAGIIQRARMACVYDTATGSARARLCSYSDGISEQNYAQVKNDGIDISYRRPTGDRYEIVMNDTLISIKLNSTVFLQMDTNGNIVSPSIFAKDFASDVAAGAGGVPVKGIYHNSGVLHIREN